LSVCVCQAFAQEEDQIQRGLNDLYSLNYSIAESRFDSVIAEYPDHPSGYYCKSSLWFYNIVSGLRTERAVEEFLKWNEKAIAVAETFQEKDAVEGMYYLGAAYSTLGRFHGVQGNWTKAFFYGRKAKNLHTKVLETSPTFYDAYIAIGLYNYYAAAAPKFVDLVASLVGLGGDRDIGIQQLETAATNSKLEKTEAEFMLANVYLDEGNYENALTLYQRLATKYPTNPFLSNQEGMAAFLLENYAAAETYFKKSLRLEQPFANMMANLYLGRSAKLKNEFASAIEYFNNTIHLAEKQNLFKPTDGWIIGSAYFHLAESYELSGERSSATTYYELGKSHPMSSKGIARGCENRLKNPVSKDEMNLVRARNQILFGDTSLGAEALLSLLVDGSPIETKLKAQANYYLGKHSYNAQNWSAAKDFLLAALDFQKDSKDQEWLEPHARYYLGVCYTRLQQKELAKTEFEKALEFSNYSESVRIKFQSSQMMKRI